MGAHLSRERCAGNGRVRGGAGARPAARRRYEGDGLRRIR